MFVTKLIILTTVSILTLANNPSSLSLPTARAEIKRIQVAFNEKRQEFLNSDLNKNNLNRDMTDALVVLEKLLADVQKVEDKNPKLGVTQQWDQMSLDIALLSPLVDFSKTIMGKDECRYALHMNKMSESSLEDLPMNRTKPVEKVLNKICNEK
ncbi:MAG: hypothetical protein H7061_00335 [Bdellovibrionaceae bacterium]|nr:hypothetical protein [Bdellovibrio sp.]